MKRFFDMKLFKTCLTLAKSQTFTVCSGDVQSHDIETEMQNYLNFVEVLVLITLLASELRQILERMNENVLSESEILRTLIEILLSQLNLKPVDIPDEDEVIEPRGLHIQKELLIDGKIEELKPQTPEVDR